MQDAMFPFLYAEEPPAGNAMARWADLLKEGSERTGRSWQNVRHYKRWMEEAGFIHVTERTFYWPVGPWAKGEYYKTVGSIFQEDLLHGLEGISFKVLGFLGWSTDEIRVFLTDVRRDMKEVTCKAYIPM
jgi:hypothetical protein